MNEILPDEKDHLFRYEIPRLSSYQFHQIVAKGTSEPEEPGDTDNPDDGGFD